MQLTLALYFIQQQTKLKKFSVCVSLKKRTSLYSLLDFLFRFPQKKFWNFCFPKTFSIEIRIDVLKSYNKFRLFAF